MLNDVLSGSDVYNIRINQAVTSSFNALEPLSSLSREEKIKEIFTLKIIENVQLLRCNLDINDPKWTSVKSRTFSFAQLFGCVEAIPFVGTPVAAISLAFHSIAAAYHHVKMDKNEVKRLNVNCVTLKEKQKLIDAAQKTFNHKLDKANHARRARASAMSIIPFLKPVVRLVQIACA